MVPAELAVARYSRCRAIVTTCGTAPSWCSLWTPDTNAVRVQQPDTAVVQDVAARTARWLPRWPRPTLVDHGPTCITGHATGAASPAMAVTVVPPRKARSAPDDQVRIPRGDCTVLPAPRRADKTATCRICAIGWSWPVTAECAGHRLEGVSLDWAPLVSSGLVTPL